jgi:hypothetical protein
MEPLAEMFISPEDAHVFFVSIFGGVEYLRICEPPFSCLASFAVGKD